MSSEKSESNGGCGGGAEGRTTNAEDAKDAQVRKGVGGLVSLSSAPSFQAKLPASRFASFPVCQFPRLPVSRVASLPVTSLPVSWLRREVEVGFAFGSLA